MVLEGHKFTDDPNDPGGPTKFGWSALGGSAIGLTEADIRNLNFGRAKELYREHYWQYIRGDDFKSEDVAFQLFEHSVHMDSPGTPRRAVRGLQLTLICFKLIVTFDGIIGDQTIGATNSFHSQQCIVDAMNVFQACQILVGATHQWAFYDMVFDRMPQLREYFRGWLRRIEISSRV